MVYNCQDDFWAEMYVAVNNFEMVRDLISIRKEHNIFRQYRKSIIKSNIKISSKLNDSNTVVTIGKGVNETFYVIFKNDYKYEFIDYSVPGF